VNKAASVSVYTGVGTFWGSGEKESDCWDNRRAPNKEADLLNFYTTTVRSKNIISGYSRGDPDSRGEVRRIPLPRTPVNKGERMSRLGNTGRDEGSVPIMGTTQRRWQAGGGM
jgi:hypothetical protein